MVPSLWQMPHTAAWLDACRLASAHSRLPQVLAVVFATWAVNFARRTLCPCRLSLLHALYSLGPHCFLYHSVLCLSEQQPALALCGSDSVCVHLCFTPPLGACCVCFGKSLCRVGTKWLDASAHSCLEVEKHVCVFTQMQRTAEFN